LVPGNVIPETPIVQGYDFNSGRDLDGLMAAMLTSGFQATALGQAVEEVNRMVRTSSRRRRSSSSSRSSSSRGSNNGGDRTAAAVA
jgi:deoxyhypusine synthase